MSELSAFDPIAATIQEAPPIPDAAPSLRERFWHSRVARKMLGGVLAGAGVVSGFAVDAAPAHADSMEYTVDADSAAGGVYARSGPHTDETQSIDGYGAYPGDTLSTICGVTDGDPVGPYNNTTWHYVVDENNPGEGKFWINAHYIDSPDKPGQLAPGEQNCDESPTDDKSTNAYEGMVAAQWALDHAKDPQVYGENECTWFVSQALWAGGVPKTADWTDQGSHGHLHPVPGTEDAWLTDDLKDYLRSKYPDSTYVPLDFSNNSVPQAKPGDIIFYDWDNDGELNHAAVVVDDASGTQYPEVSEWGNVLHAGESSQSVKQGWTWSRIGNNWIQSVYPNPRAYLFHINIGTDGLHVLGDPNGSQNVG